MSDKTLTIEAFPNIMVLKSGYHDGQRWYERPHPSPFVVYCPPLRVEKKTNTVVVWRKTTEALKGHRVVWKIEIYYLIRMT